MIFVVGGSSGGGFSTKNAVIHVNASLGSTITFSKGGVVVKSLGPTDAFSNADGETADYYYPVKATNYGEWTVTATKNIYTSVKTVEVNAAKQYDVKIIYQLMLYNSGNTYDYPWRIVRYGYAMHLLPSGETLKVNSHGGGGNITPGDGFTIDQKIDLSNYSTFYAHFITSTMVAVSKVCVFASSDFTGHNQFYRLLVDNNHTNILAETITEKSYIPSDGIISCNISDLQGEAYINVGARCVDTRLNLTFEVDRVWLE